MATYQESIADSISAQDTLSELLILGSEQHAKSMITVEFDWGTPDGNLDITTTSDLGGDELPIAALFQVAGRDSTGISRTDAEISTGLFDGTNQVVLGGGERNNVDFGLGTSKAFHQLRDDAVMLELDGRFNSINRQASAVEFITNGVRINVPSDYGSNKKGFVTLFFDPGGQAEVGTYDPNDTQDSSVTVSPGFEADAIISIGARNEVDNDSEGAWHMIPNIGFAVNGGNQVSIYRWSENSNGAGQVTEARLQNNRGAIINLSGPYIEYDNFTSTSFDATTRDAAASSSNRVAYLALSMPNVSLHVGVLDTPTSSGFLDIDDLGFSADGALFGTSNLETENSTSSDIEGGGFAVGQAGLFGATRSSGAANLDGNPSHTEEFFLESIRSTAGDDTHKVDADGFNPRPDGFRLDFNTVHSTAKKWIYLAAEGEAANLYTRTLLDAIAISEELILSFDVLIAEAISLAETHDIRWKKTVTEAVAISEDPVALAHFKNVLDEDISLSETPTGILVATGLVQDTLGLGDIASAIGVFQNVVTESFSLKLGLNIEGEEFLGLAINTSNLALTKYSGYNFNSFAQVGERYLGAGSDGIYLLSGDDDAGTAIDASARTAMFDFGADFKKRVPRAYLGIRGDGDVYLKTITNEEEENWYRVQDVKQSFQNRRVKMGRGVESTAWQFELENVDGAYFELHDMTLIPVILTRRVE